MFFVEWSLWKRLRDMQDRNRKGKPGSKHLKVDIDWLIERLQGSELDVLSYLYADVTPEGDLELRWRGGYWLRWRAVLSVDLDSHGARLTETDFLRDQEQKVYEELDLNDDEDWDFVVSEYMKLSRYRSR